MPTSRRRMGPPSSGSRCPFGEAETKRLASTGVKNNARTSDVRRATAIVSASERKKTPVTPVRRESGRNTTTGVIVERLDLDISWKHLLERSELHLHGSDDRSGVRGWLAQHVDEHRRASIGCDHRVARLEARLDGGNIREHHRAVVDRGHNDVRD